MGQAVSQAPIALNLLSGISEHLNESLQEIFDHSQRLRQQAKKEENAGVCLNDVEAISSGCADVLLAVGQLMDLVQLERDAVEFFEQEVHIQDVLERVYLNSCDLAKKKGAALRLSNMAPDAKVLADPGRVQQILGSLLYSALVRSGDDALIELTAKLNGDGGLEITVATGEPLGEARDAQPISAGSAMEAARLELDLSIADRIAKRMQCDLKIEAEPGRDPVHVLAFSSDRTVSDGHERSVA